MFPIVVDLPPKVWEGIGKVVAAHAVLENRVQELLFDAMKVDYPQGRVAFENYRDPAVQFGIVRKLFDSWGIQVDINLEDLESEIRDRTRTRNILAHGVWLNSAEGKLVLRVTEGQFSTEHGIHVRAFLPESRIVADDLYDTFRNQTLNTARMIIRLHKAVKSALVASPGKSAQPSDASSHIEGHSPQESSDPQRS